jgi:hypothetical protein
MAVAGAGPTRPRLRGQTAAQAAETAEPTGQAAATGFASGDGRGVSGGGGAGPQGKGPERGHSSCKRNEGGPAERPIDNSGPGRADGDAGAEGGREQQEQRGKSGGDAEHNRRVGAKPASAASDTPLEGGPGVLPWRGF